jgi:hypothetical protein
MARRVMVILLLSGGLALATLAQEQESSPPRPSVINSTYVVTIPVSGQITQHLHEEDGQLLVDKKYANGVRLSGSVKYEKVNYVSVGGDSFTPDAKKRTVEVDDSEGGNVTMTLPTEVEAKTVAEYVVARSPLNLELIADAWRVRKPFECPEGSQPGCRDFKELLDHDDADIARFFYERDENAHVYACFSNEQRWFFVVHYTHYGKFGVFSRVAFTDGQSNASDIRIIDWSLGDSGAITQRKQGQKPETLGWVDSSSLSYQTKFTNRMNTTTQYELSIRWSTGRYSESWSGKDDKGERFSTDSSGICVNLH